MPVLSESALTDYERDGFVVLKGALSDAEVARVETGFARNPPLHGTLDVGGAVYPEPGRYTLARNSLKDPDLVSIAEHPTITAAAGQALGADPRLTAFVLYDRTPGGPPIHAHNDYKRWRPVGSSMNWLFTIVPFCDFDAAAGPLFVAPGSHHPERVTQGPERPLRVAAPTAPPPEAYIDPGLKRGDLLLMNMHLWHRADGNNADHHRAGAFNKYAAVNAPPATGYYLYDDDVHAALSPQNRSLLAVHSDKPIATTRLLLVRQRNEPEVLLVDGASASAGPGLVLPGGPSYVEQAIPDWDRGNVIASLQTALRDTVQVETPWVSYVGDVDEGDHLCRVYAYTLTGQGFPVPYEGRWLTSSQLADADAELAFGYESELLERWLDPSIVRGKGLSQAQSRVDQYAY